MYTVYARNNRIVFASSQFASNISVLDFSILSKAVRLSSASYACPFSLDCNVLDFKCMKYVRTKKSVCTYGFCHTNFDSVSVKSCFGST